MARIEQIPVTLVTGALPELDSETALLRLPAGTGHDHADGVQCVACTAQSDVRALLYNLLHEMRSGARARFTRVVVDASAVSDIDRLRAALRGELPALGLRDHEVARAFRLE
ncbi:hypothetical protein [Devosia sp. A449]